MTWNLKRKRPRSGSLAVMAAVALLAAACGGSDGATPSAPAPAAAPETNPQEQVSDFYSGQTIELLVPFSPGGGTDTAARFIAPFLEKYLPGNPSIQVVNETGGGGVSGANLYETRRERNGYNLTLHAPSTLLPFLVGQPEVAYDLTAQVPLWVVPAGRTIYARDETGVRSASDLLNPRVALLSGGRGPTGGDLLTLLGFEALGLREAIPMIFGYDGGGPQALAMEQGEFNINHWGTQNVVRRHLDLVNSGDFHLVYTHGMTRGNQVFPDEALPDVPTILDAYRELHGSDPSGDAWEAFNVFNNVVGNGAYGLFIHGDAPAVAVDLLREALAQIVQDPEYIANADAVLGPYRALAGADVIEYQAAWQNLPRGPLAWAQNFLAVNYGIDDLVPRS